MPEVSEELLSEIVRKIVEETDPERIILFGSYARGEAYPDSDLDLLVVKREPFSKNHSRFREINRLYECLSGIGVSKDILMYSSGEIAQWKNSINHVVARAMHEGKVLYERS